MINWKLEETGCNQERISQTGNKYLVGNGYLGIRGTLQEYRKEQFPAINLAGIYDQVGNAWREPLNAPNGLYTYIEFNHMAYRLPEVTPLKHSISLDYRYAVFNRSTSWNTPEGSITITADRFASLKEPHLIAMHYSFTPQCEGEVKLITGIDGEVWDINGPHYDEMDIVKLGDALQAVAVTQEHKDAVCVCEMITTDFEAEEDYEAREREGVRVIRFLAQAGRQYHLYKYIGIYTSKDCSNYLQQAERTVREAKADGYHSILKQHKERWERKWNITEVTIDGDDPAMEALNYSIYHLHCIAPRHSNSLSIAARGLSGQTYKGAVFWDTEMFMLDFFLMTEPEVAKTLLNYRIETLEGARKKAKVYGYSGAFYAWESQEGGYDACSDYNVTDVFTGRPMRTYFKDKQIHISAAVVYGIMRYVEFSGCLDILMEGGAEVVLECACFYYDLLMKRVNCDRYELLDVIGPDEYHERVNNNAYTNRMAKYTFDCAVKVVEQLKELDADTQEYLANKYDLKHLSEVYQDASDRLYIPQPEACTGIIEQFDGYKKLEDATLKEVRGRLLNEKEYWGGAYGIASHTKIIKQADVVTMLNLFSEDYSEEILLKNWQYYEPRTEHGSSLSACMYAILACKCHMPDQAYPFFMKSARSDISQSGKEWAGLIYIGGTHPASAGGAYMTAIEGFAGIHIENGVLKAAPSMPGNWIRMSFKIVFQGNLYFIEVTKSGADIKMIGKLEHDV